MQSVILVQPGMGFYDLVVRNLPLGLLSIVRNLENVRAVIIDQRIPGWQKKLKTALEEKPLAVGLSVTTGLQIAYALEISRAVKRFDADIPVIWGGIHPTLLPEQTVARDCIDIVVKGEAEYTFPELLACLSGNGKESLFAVYR
ncbi:MAG TPA: cobalamin-dependent protein, partial [bacterium]|nr:cobalamin-dependent protein [bacterium]